jgi:nucleotide-binding universal stress UspA family protein
MFNRILLPLDGSALAERAIPHAEQFARIFGAGILLLHVLEPDGHPENSHTLDPLSWQIRKAEAYAYLQGIAASIRKNLGENQRKGAAETKSRVEYALREGKTAENILDFAYEENVDLLVLSTHGSSGISRWSISSVASKVINSIYVHILIVRSFDQAQPDDTRALYRRILIPIDTSRRAEFALPVGIALTRWDQANPVSESSGEKHQLILVDILKPPEVPLSKPYPLEIRKLTEQLMQANRRFVNDYINELKERLQIECETYMFEDEKVSARIQELAGKDHIDLVVLSAHGHSGQFIGPFGTITRDYIEHGSRPVLVLQDMPRSQVQPTAAQIVAEKSGRR